jgi:hypothetical protein
MANTQTALHPRERIISVSIERVCKTEALDIRGKHEINVSQLMLP